MHVAVTQQAAWLTRKQGWYPPVSQQLGLRNTSYAHLQLSTLAAAHACKQLLQILAVRHTGFIAALVAVSLHSYACVLCCVACMSGTTWYALHCIASHAGRLLSAKQT